MYVAKNPTQIILTNSFVELKSVIHIELQSRGENLLLIFFIHNLNLTKIKLFGNFVYKNPSESFYLIL